MRRAQADVHGNVEHLAAHHPAKLCLRVAQLVVQAAQYSKRRARVVVLHKRLVNPGSSHSVGPVGLHEEAARIVMNTRLEEQDTRKRRFDDLQTRPRCWRLSWVRRHEDWGTKGRL